MERILSKSFASFQESVLGGVILLLIAILYFFIRTVFNHIKESDDRWAKSIDNNTKALKEVADAHKDHGDKVGAAIERALLYRRLDDRND